MINDMTHDNLRQLALEARPRLFEEVINLHCDDLPYIGHLITKTAIEAGYIARRSNLKGKTILEWSRVDKTEGKGAPNQWACLAAVDILIKKNVVPEPDDDELWAAYIFYWLQAHGPFENEKQAFQSLPVSHRIKPAAVRLAILMNLGQSSPLVNN